MFLTPGAKLAQKVNVNTSVYQAIVETRGEAAAAKTVTACRAFQELRAALHEPPVTEITRRAIKRYLSAFHHLVYTCKIPTTLSTGLLWVNAFDGNDHCIVNDLQIDHVCALFNLGVCEATLAVNSFRTRRTNPNALTDAAKHFQVAAGYFHAASQLPSPGGIRAVTCDLYPPTLRALEMVMLGNAQQALYEITLKKHANAILARFAVGAKDFYLIAEDCCKDPDVVNTCINGYVGRPAGALAAYFDVVAQSAHANAAKDNHDMAQQLGRLEMAQKSLDTSLDTVTSLDTSSLASVTNLRTNLITELENLKSDIAQRLEDAHSENRKIYFITPAKNLPDIVGRQGVKPANVTNVLTEESVDERLRAFDHLPEAVSPEVSGIASRYADIAAKLVADQVAAISTSAASLQAIVRQAETSIRLARSTAAAVLGHPSQAPVSTLDEEQKAINALLGLQQKGSLSRLRELQSQVLKLAAETKFQVQSIDIVLQNEGAEDRELRARVYTTRPTSAAMTQSYIESLTTMKGKLEQAASADKVVAAQIDHNAQAISLASKTDLTGFVPPSASTDSFEYAGQSQRVEALIAEMEPEIAKAETSLAERGRVVQEFEKKKQLENPYALTMDIHLGDAEVERCTEIIGREYGDLRQRANALRGEMDRIYQFLSDADVRLKTPNSNEGKGNEAQLKMNEVYKHQAAALKFAELMGHLEHGIHFYTREQDAIKILRHDVEGFVAARSTEARGLLNLSPGNSRSSGGNLYPSGPPQYPPGSRRYSPSAQNPHGRSPPYQGNPSNAGAWRRL